jgi:hypothetical protein
MTRDLYPDHQALADAGPILFALLLPLTFRGDSGFIYDFSEIGLYCLGLFLLLRGRYLVYLAVLPIIVLNKESNVLMIVLAAIVVLTRLPRNKALLHLAAQGAVSLVVVLVIRGIFADHPGGSVEHHLAGNIEHWTRLSSYTELMSTSVFFIPIPKPQNLLFAPFLAWLTFHGWKEKPLVLKRLFLASVIINIPLFLLFCYRDELRNLSLMFPFIYLMFCQTFLSFYRSQASTPAPAHGGERG